MKEAIVEVRTPDGDIQITTVRDEDSAEIVIDESINIGGTHIERFTTVTVRGVR